MPTLSVKLADDTKQRLTRLAIHNGISAHAFMVDAIETALANAEHRSSFVAAALRSRRQVLASGQVLDGPNFNAYLRAKVRGGKPVRPRTISISSVLPKV